MKAIAKHNKKCEDCLQARHASPPTAVGSVALRTRINASLLNAKTAWGKKKTLVCLQKRPVYGFAAAGHCASHGRYCH